MKTKLPVLSLLLCALFLLSACGETETAGKEDSSPASASISESTSESAADTEDSSVAVQVARVERSAISSETTISGQVAAAKQEAVLVATTARCTTVEVKQGDRVSAGQTICTLDVASTMANYQTALMGYESARQSYEDQSAVLSSQVALAEKNVSDTRALLEIGAASQMELDNAILTLENARTGMDSALSQLEMSMQNYQATMKQLEDAMTNVENNGIVTAPISGVIISLGAVENSFVSPSSPVAVIESDQDRDITVSVSESLVSHLQPGGKASVYISAAEREIQGTVDTIDKSANPVTHLYSVTVKIPSSQVQGLLSGMFADVTFFTDTRNDAVIIPTEAIQTGTDEQYVYILDENNIAHKIPVETGLVGDGVTEITSGLSGGETLVTVGQFYLSDGAAARVVSSGV